uniref:Ig-like domain-containing protein n=1 Tax=Dromaius novaehollandiae TaxID=8790 RepID=A0A8C4KP64_DRONO
MPHLSAKSLVILSLLLSGTDKVKKSSILTKPRSITVSEGETARFSCDVDGEPAPVITWLRAGQPIVSSRRFQVTRTQYKSTFEISLVQMSDEGSYTVVVENSEGRQEAHFTLTIQRTKIPEKTIISPPRIKSPEPRVKSPEPVKSPKRVKSPEPTSTPPKAKSPPEDKMYVASNCTKLTPSTCLTIILFLLFLC